MINKSKTVICIDLQGNKYEVNVSELTFRPAIYCIIIKDNKILLSRQWDGYDFPGGGVNLGEPTKEALVREVREETGFDVKVGEVIACEDSFFKLPYEGNFVHSILIYYLCSITGGELTDEFLDGFEKEYASKAEWISLDKTKGIKFCNTIDRIEILEKAKKLIFNQ